MFLPLNNSKNLIVFIASFVAAFFLIPPHIFLTWAAVLAAAFMLSFSLVFTCVFDNIRTRVHLYKTYHFSFWHIILSILGISAFQVCGIGAPICIGSGLAWLLPGFLPLAFRSFFADFSIYFIILSILIQLYILYKLHCFNRSKKSLDSSNPRKH